MNPALRAVTDVLIGDCGLCRQQTEHHPAMHAHESTARRVLEALVSDPAVRSSVVRALKDAAATADGTPMPGIRPWVLADVVLSALGGDDA